MSCAAILEKHRTKQQPTRDYLTERQKHILTMICEEMTINAIASAIDRAPKTVEKHRQAINKVAGTHCPIGLYKWAITHGYTEAPQRVDK